MNTKFPEPQPFSKNPRPPISLTPVESSQVGAIGYDDATKTLAVQFKRGSGAIYHYPNVERETFDAFKGAESIGAYFGKHLKALPFEKFEPEPEAPQPPQTPQAAFKLGDRVRKRKGSQWQGRVVGTYSTELTPEGYAVESETERGSVQIYPAAALELAPQPPQAAELLDAARLDWLEGEYEREQKWLRGDKPVGQMPPSLFRSNMPITRAAIDAAIAASKRGTR